MNRQRLYENIMKDLRRAFKRSLNEDILDDIDIDEPEEDNVTSKINKQNQEMVEQIVNDAVKQMINKKKQLPEYIYNSEAVWKPKDSEELKFVIKTTIEICGKEVNLNWIDVSEITDMSKLFYESEFNGDISNWNVSNVTNMRCMFCNSQFNSDISQWVVSNVTDMSQMFKGSKFNGDISKWNVSNVIKMASMFCNSQFNSDISQWVVSNVNDMSQMFKASPLESNPPKWYKR